MKPEAAAAVSRLLSLKDDEIARLRGLLESARPFVEHAVEHAAVERDVDLLQSIDAALSHQQKADGGA